MEELKHLPRAYQFSFDIKTMTLFLSIEKWTIKEIHRILRNQTNIMDFMYKTYGGDRELFIPFGEKGQSFGYQKSIDWVSENDYEIIYCHKIGPTSYQTQEICERCNGTKIDFLEHPCRQCHETGKKFALHEKSFSDALLSLYPIIRLLNMALLENCIDMKKDEERKWIAPKNERKQLSSVHYTDSSGRHNCGIEAWIDEDIMSFIKEIENEKTLPIREAMQKTEETLLSRKKDIRDFSFELYYENVFSFQVPGEACALGTSLHGIGMFGSFGHTLHCHNVDDRFQQITFIVGLAVLSDMAEKWLAEKEMVKV